MIELVEVAQLVLCALGAVVGTRGVERCEAHEVAAAEMHALWRSAQPLEHDGIAHHRLVQYEENHATLVRRACRATARVRLRVDDRLLVENVDRDDASVIVEYALHCRARALVLVARQCDLEARASSACVGEPRRNAQSHRDALAVVRLVLPLDDGVDRRVVVEAVVLQTMLLACTTRTVRRRQHSAPLRHSPPCRRETPSQDAGHDSGGVDQRVRPALCEPCVNPCGLADEPFVLELDAVHEGLVLLMSDRHLAQRLAECKNEIW